MFVVDSGVGSFCCSRGVEDVAKSSISVIGFYSV